MNNNYTVTDEETLETIADFLEKGFVENIAAMFCQDQSLYGWTGRLLDDERYIVRMGMVVLFEELATRKTENLSLALDSLIPLLDEKIPAYVRGEAATIIGIIGTEEARAILQTLLDDKDAQIKEIVGDILSGEGDLGN